LNMQYEIQKMRMELMRASPFYGSLLLNIPILEDRSIPTACTDGRRISYNPAFMKSLSEPERRFTLMHELFHILLRHPSRCNGRKPFLYNVAADLIVNDFCKNLSVNRTMRQLFPMEQPKGTLSAEVDRSMSMEELYAKILNDQSKLSGNGKRRGGTLVMLRDSYIDQSWNKQKQIPTERFVPDPGSLLPDGMQISPGVGDLEAADLSEAEQAELEQALRRLVRDAAKGEPGIGVSMFAPRQILCLGERKPLPWKRLLRDFVTEQTDDDDASYATPERKYIHMDLILPGHSLTEGELEQVWTFVDSSGSIGQDELNKFLTELYHLIKDLHCTLNVAYWDTKVTDVYRKVDTVAKLNDSKPKHTGGTDINCVYRWIVDNKVKPDVLLILTDGYFGKLRGEFRSGKLRKKTIIVLSDERTNGPDMRQIGRVAVLGG